MLNTYSLIVALSLDITASFSSEMGIEDFYSTEFRDVTRKYMLEEKEASGWDFFVNALWDKTLDDYVSYVSAELGSEIGERAGRWMARQADRTQQILLHRWVAVWADVLSSTRDTGLKMDAATRFRVREIISQCWDHQRDTAARLYKECEQSVSEWDAAFEDESGEESNATLIHYITDNVSAVRYSRMLAELPGDVLATLSAWAHLRIPEIW